MTNKNYFIIASCSTVNDNMAQKIINNCFNSFINDLNPGEYPIKHETETHKFYNDFIIYYINDDYNFKSYYKSNISAERFLEINGITPTSIIEFIQNKIDNGEFPSSIKIGFMKQNKIKPTPTKNPDNTNKKYRWTKRSELRCKKTIGEYERQGIRVININEKLASNEHKNGNKYVYAVRYVDNEYPCKFYTLTNATEIPSNYENLIKSKYTLEMQCNYFETKPILYVNWLKKDE